jgi:hypothetical protein
LVCREHFERASSLYNQRVKDLDDLETLAPSPFLISRLGGLTYLPMIRRLAAFGFPVDVLNYHPADTFVPSFLRHIGYAEADSAPIQFHNVGINVKTLIALLAMNRVAATREERDRYFKAALKMRNSWSRAKFIFAPPAVDIAAPVFAADRHALAAEFALNLPAPAFSTLRDLFEIDADDLAEVAELCAQFGAPGQIALAVAQAYRAGTATADMSPFWKKETQITAFLRQEAAMRPSSADAAGPAEHSGI